MRMKRIVILQFKSGLGFEPLSNLRHTRGESDKPLWSPVISSSHRGRPFDQQEELKYSKIDAINKFSIYLFYGANSPAFLSGEKCRSSKTF